MKKKVIISISLILFILLAVWITMRYIGNKDKVYYWRSVSVERSDVNIIVTATGAIQADTSVDVGVQVSGAIAKIKADFNDVVKKGQIIAILDTNLYYSAKIDALSAVQRASSSLAQAKREFDRSKILFENDAVAKADNDLAITNYQNAQGNLTSAKALLSRAIVNLKYCTIKAPISGIIIARNMQVGNMVIASFNSPVLFTIANDLKNMQVQADVDEADIGLVKVGQKAKFTVDAFPNDVFTGIVSQVRRQPIIVQNVVNYIAIIEVSNPDLKLVPGLTANSNILIKERKNVLKVPTNAFTFIPPIEYIEASKLLPDSTKKFWSKKIREIAELKKQQIVESNMSVGYLWIIKNKDIFPKQVTRGLNDGSFTEVNGSIAEGEEVVTGINSSATPKDKVKSPFMPTFPSRKK